MNGEHQNFSPVEAKKVSDRKQIDRRKWGQT